MNIGAAELDGNGVRVTVRTDAAVHRISWMLPEEGDGNVADAFLAAGLLPAMAQREPLHVEGPISRRLLSSVGTIQDIFSSWSSRAAVTRRVAPPFGRVAVTGTERTCAPAPAPGVASFFSAGVDSFYTVLEHRHELTGLVFVHGFDVPLDDIAQRERVVGGAREAAKELGLPLLEVETDVRRFSDLYVGWVDYHGAALASVALLLAPWFGRVYIPATQTYGTLTPLGSHPLVDPLWSSERVEIVHDGCEAGRLEKIRRIEPCATARKWLRVCPHVRSGTYNCGRCEKCTRTMAAIRALKLGGRFTALPDLEGRPALRKLARTPIPANTSTWDLVLREAQSSRDRALVRRLRCALLRQRALRALKVRLYPFVGPVLKRLRTRRGR